MSIVQQMDPVAKLSVDLQAQMGLQQFPGHSDNLWNDCGALKGTDNIQHRRALHTM